MSFQTLYLVYRLDESKNPSIRNFSTKFLTKQIKMSQPSTLNDPFVQRNNNMQFFVTRTKQKEENIEPIQVIKTKSGSTVEFSFFTSSNKSLQFYSVSSISSTFSFYWWRKSQIDLSISVLSFVVKIRKRSFICNKKHISCKITRNYMDLQ